MAQSAKTKKARLARDIRRENLARAIDLSWGSLKTHLSGSVAVPKKGINIQGNEEFHARCVREYAEVIYTAAVELHELTKKDFKWNFE